MNIFRAEL